ncbi:MAG TPA: DNA cytosine methyltransferase [Actinophytocola sp.]|uniref:DNA cytosine methyltransferase n=1 Tax=Actinophytocola sp. TaxID=1872138 RepID=UPI002DBD4085|nr:DNA cytosine methyltransferase [Actinophytocola sp.]HEU5475674.1 DNA cytosine methyltransferase [Actinophytocola sp.]
MITVTDLFCGAGGSGLGATAVPGVELYLAANHSPRAIETHALNFPDCRHDCADISQVEPRRYRRTNILWASPECTNHSVAKGRKRTAAPDGDLFGEPVPDHVAERSRATMWDVPRFAEVHRYDAIIVENVVDAAMWPAFAAWLMAMDAYGYHHQVVFLNSMHAPAINAPRAPQSRDRMYVVFWRRGNRAPNLDIRPLAWCPSCDREVRAVQVFKPRGKTWPLARWGRYRAQYVYRCPTPRCHADVEPYALPAASAIDWDTPGERIGDRDKPLSDKTLARIRAGLARYAQPVTLEAAGNTFERRPGVRCWPVDGPTPTLTTTATRALACPPLLVPAGGTRNDTAAPVTDPFRTRTTTENEALLVPVEGRDGLRAAPTAEPMRTQTARHETALVVPYYRTGRAQPDTEPLPTLTTVDRAGVAFIAELRGGGSTARTVREPLAAVCAQGNHHMLVRHNSTPVGDPGYLCTPACEPARTITTAGHQSLVGWPAEPPEVEDCTFRMLTVPEIQAAMAFTPGYQITGSKREQVKQLGNAVTPPAAEWLIRAVVEALEGTA